MTAPNKVKNYTDDGNACEWKDDKHQELILIFSFHEFHFHFVSKTEQLSLSVNFPFFSLYFYVIARGNVKRVKVYGMWKKNINKLWRHSRFSLGFFPRMLSKHLGWKFFILFYIGFVFIFRIIKKNISRLKFFKCHSHENFQVEYKEKMTYFSW